MRSKEFGLGLAAITVSALALTGCSSTGNTATQPDHSEPAVSQPSPAVERPKPIDPCENVDFETSEAESTTCLSALKKQLHSQGFKVTEVSNGMAAPFWADVTLPQCKKTQEIGFYDNEDPITISVIGGLDDGTRFTKPNQIPASRCE